MQLNIKDAEVYEMARTLATRRRTSLTEVVKTALRNETARDETATRSPEEQAMMLARVRALMEPLDHARAAGEHVPSQAELDGWMYGEDGLPR